MPPLIIRKMCIWHQEAKHCFPFKTENRAVVATGLGCTERSNLGQPLQNRASRKDLFLCGEKHWKRKLFQYRGFLHGWDASDSCCRVGKAQQEIPGGKSRNIIQKKRKKKKSESFQPQQLTAQLKRKEAAGKKQSCYISSLCISLQLWVLGDPFICDLTKLKKS